MSNEKKNGEDFWDLGDFRKNQREISQNTRQNVCQDHSYIRHTDAVSIDIGSNQSSIADKRQQSFDQAQSFSDASITKFIPPHTDSAFKKKHLLFEFPPSNPYIKKVKFLSEREGDKLFVSENLFMRERAALLHRSAPESPYVPYYSYSPRYSQLTKPQLRYYLWWRENARNGIFKKTDESYILLYAYELAATSNEEDVNKSLHILCSLLTAYTIRELNIVMKTMIRDIICDLCLVHGLTPPMAKLESVERQVINNSFLPEMFIDLDVNNDTNLTGIISASMSLYDYKKSKYYTADNAAVFDNAIMGAVQAVLRNKEAFESITSFTRGMYGAVTSERHPFNRMVNIVNRNLSVEVTYFEISNIRPAITDMIRYSENKLREHLGIKNKISIMSVNPIAKSVIDNYFDINYPQKPIVDRRRRDARIDENEIHEYDKLYDLPKTELSPERAMEIERESWDTTKILTEAFGDSDVLRPNQQNAVEHISEATVPSSALLDTSFTDTGTDSCAPTSFTPTSGGDTYSEIFSRIGDGAKLISLCFIGAPLIEQRQLASNLGISLDELADTINETSVDIIGDIILEYDGSSYVIIEDYKDLFNDL